MPTQPIEKGLTIRFDRTRPVGDRTEVIYWELIQREVDFSYQQCAIVDAPEYWPWALCAEGAD